jgi:hypothetical protein
VPEIAAAGAPVSGVVGCTQMRSHRMLGAAERSVQRIRSAANPREPAR